MPKSFTDINKLIKFLKLNNENKNQILLNSSFPLFLPFRLAKKIIKNDLTDPILRQFVPLKDEEIKKKSFSIDPLEEIKFQTEKFLKKYKNRALLLTTNTCLVHCRFCFRKYSLKKLTNKNFTNEIKLIQKDKSIEEIILSGGDPLALSNQSLLSLLNELDNISHIKRIRFHTKVVVADPQRINFQFLNIFKNLKKQIIFVFHINHPIEIDEDIVRAIKRLKKKQFLLFNQSVLLKGVNDDFITLKTLNENLLKIGVIPYYIHQLDKVNGTCHFQVEVKTGKKLLSELNENMSGYMIPKYVKEIARQKSKTTLI